MATIRCEDCGATRTRCPSNTKYCRSCRLLRDLEYWRENRRYCKRCKAQFAPLNRADYHCSACDPGRTRDPVESCVLGAWTATKLGPHGGSKLLTGIPVCASCLRSPKMRSFLIAILESGQKLRKEHNNETTQG